MEKEKILEDVINYLSGKDKEKPFIGGKTEIPVSGGKLSYFDIINLVDAALDGWMTEGKWAEKFKHALSEYTGYNHVVLCNSGSSANLLAMTAIKEKYKIESKKFVLTSALAFPTTVAPIIQAGFIPCFIDINLKTLNPDADSIKNALDSKKNIVGVILAHTLGFPYSVQEIDILCKERGLFHIQDTCDALGAKTGENENLSQYGDIGTLSFFPAHQLTTGEGGAVLCNDGRLMRIIESYSNWGRSCFPAGTNISISGGTLPIEQIHKGYWVRTHTGEYNKVSETFKRNYSGQLYEIKTRNRPIINVTSEHPFYVDRNGIKDWVCAKDLVKGDILLEAIPKRTEINRTIYLTYETLYGKKEEFLNPNREVARLVGYWVAEGSLASGLKGKSGYKESKYLSYRVDFSFAANELEYIADVRSLMKKYFGVSGYQRTYHNSNGITLSFKSRKGYEFFKLFGRKAETKQLPPYALYWGTDLLIEFVKGFWRGDGSSSWQGFSIFSTSPFLIEQIREILLRCGVLCSQWVRKSSSYTSSEINGKLPSQEYELNALHIYGKNAETFGELIDEEYKSRSDRLNSWIDSGYAHYPITSIKTSDVQDILVYNLEIENHHSYHANGLVVHNCWCRPGEMDNCGKRFEQDFKGLPKGYDHKYITSRVGYNLKMTELQAALGMSQMSDIKCFVSQRRKNYTYLKKELSKIPNFLAYFSLFHYPVFSSPFGFPIRVNPDVINRSQIIQFLENRKIRTRPIFAGNITRQPMLAHQPYDQVGHLRNCDTIMNHAFWIGVQPSLSKEQLDYVIGSFGDFIGEL